VSCQRVNATGQATREVSVARARVVRETEKTVLPSNLKFTRGSGEVLGGFRRAFIFLGEGPAVVLYPTTCACLPLLLSQPERVDGEKSKSCTSSPPLPLLPLGDG
jgi:hypothetical protein